MVWWWPKQSTTFSFGHCSAGRQAILVNSIMWVAAGHMFVFFCLIFIFLFWRTCMLPPLGLTSVLPSALTQTGGLLFQNIALWNWCLALFLILPPYLGLRAEYSQRSDQSIRCQAVLADIHIFDKTYSKAWQTNFMSVPFENVNKPVGLFTCINIM